MSFVLRPIQPADNPKLATLIRQVLIEDGANCPGFAWADPELDHLSEGYGDRGAYYVVTVNNAIAGGAGFAPFSCEYPDFCALQKMYLLPARNWHCSTPKDPGLCSSPRLSRLLPGNF
jgi:putative acetyltransferase